MNRSIFRVRDKNEYKLNVPEFIQYVEEHFKTEFISLPDWERLLVRIHAITTDRDLILQEANARKQEIIQKLLVEYTRPTPFECYPLGYTCKNQAKMEKKVTTDQKNNKIEEKIDEAANDDIDETPHQNTEEILEVDDYVSSTGTETVQDLLQSEYGNLPGLPNYIVTNEHRLLLPSKSSLDAIDSQFSKSIDTVVLQQTKMIASSPKEIVLKYDYLDKQVVKFSVSNLSREVMYVGYHNMPHTPEFKYTKIVPVAPLKLFPGITLPVKLIFKLVERKREFTSELIFKVGKTFFKEITPTEILRVPIITKFTKSRNVQISNAVYIPPLYPWQLTEKYPLYPKAFVKIEVKDDRVYHLHIEKKVIKDSIISLNERRKSSFLSEAQSNQSIKKEDKENQENPATDAVKPNEDKSIKPNKAKKGKKEKYTTSKRKSSRIEKYIILSAAEENKNNEKVYDPVLLAEMAPLVDLVVDLALDTFIFENTYLLFKPNVKVMLPVYLTKLEHLGSINCYYEFKLMDPELEVDSSLVLTKLVRIFADVISCPIQFEPPRLLVMESDVKFGFWKDHFSVHNRDKINKVSIKVTLPEELKKQVSITPMKTLIPNLSSVEFAVKFCSAAQNYTTLENIHFSLEITVVFGPKYYIGMRPIYYEIIAPCVTELRDIMIKEINKTYG